MLCCLVHLIHMLNHKSHEKMEKDVKDPVCNMQVDEEITKYKIEYKGKMYYFCSSTCESEFKKNPSKYI